MRRREKETDDEWVGGLAKRERESDGREGGQRERWAARKGLALTEALSCNPFEVRVLLEVQPNHICVVLDVFSCGLIVWVVLHGACEAKQKVACARCQRSGRAKHCGWFRRMKVPNDDVRKCEASAKL
jgi:hypothetical protein